MWEALDIAHAADFVRAMPGGLGATIAQGGANVSGGQRQRLSIARAIIRRPQFYLFDDAFSALDLSTEAAVRHNLQRLTAEAATILVAQRVSSIREATKILVLEDGVTVGSGTHDELLATCATYEEIVLSQAQVSGVGS
jgi:ATP-binding cassette subfamily B protein